MAQKIQTLLVDDLDGSEAEGTVRFGLAIFGRELVDVCVKFHAARGRRARLA
jgi:hypothetical protein